MSEERLKREAEFHNKTFGENTRQVVKKYYNAARLSKDTYKEKVLEFGRGRKVLEYGCGPGSQAYILAENGADVTAIDISEVAIQKAEKEATSKGLSIDFHVMDAENLEFEDGTFDLVCGSGILHHLDLDKAYNEVSRVLKQGGKGVFFEPLGHNPIINLYRSLTPNLRTDDEHPLLQKDLVEAGKYFSNVDIDYFHMLTILASFIGNEKVKNKLAALLNKGDTFLFRYIPFLRKYAWICVITLNKE